VNTSALLLYPVANLREDPEMAQLPKVELFIQVVDSGIIEVDS
jgi:hypothetical protein